MFKHLSRLGWLGIPAGSLLSLAMLFTSLGDEAVLAPGMLLAAAAATRLPRFDRLAAIGVGALAAYLLIWVVPAGGADSPLNWLAAACSAAFALGALAATLLALVPGGRPGSAPG